MEQIIPYAIGIVIFIGAGALLKILGMKTKKKVSTPPPSTIPPSLDVDVEIHKDETERIRRVFGEKTRKADEADQKEGKERLDDIADLINNE